MKGLGVQQIRTLRVLASGEAMSTDEVRAALGEAGRNSTVSVRLSSLTRRGLLHRVAHGRYSLSVQGRTELALHEERLAARRALRAQALRGAA